MKRIGNLFENIISISNLYEASKNASKGKNKRKDVKKWNNNLFNNILNLHDDLKNGNYKVSEYLLYNYNK
jgi:RNA-directed DNA polymerase